MNYQDAYDRLIQKRIANPVCKPEYFERHHIKPRALGGSDEKSNIVRLTAREHFIAHLLLAKIHGGKMWIAAHYMMNSKSKSAKGVSVSSRTYKTVKEQHSKHKSESSTGDKNHWFGKEIPIEFRERMRGPRPSVAGVNNPNYGKDRKEVGEIISHVKSYKPNAKPVDLSIQNKINEMLGIKTTSSKKHMLGEDLRNLRAFIRFKYLDVRDMNGANNPNYGNGAAISGDKNPMFGKAHSLSTKSKIGEKAKRRITCPKCGKDGNIANMHRWHFDNCKVGRDNWQQSA